jgi:hypothetical protein
MLIPEAVLQTRRLKLGLIISRDQDSVAVFQSVAFPMMAHHQAGEGY